MIKKELRHIQQRSMFCKKAAIFAFWGGIFASFFEIGFDSGRGLSASLIDPTNRRLLRNPHTDRPAFLRSMSLHPRTAVRPGRYAGLLLTPNWQRWSGRSRHTYFTILLRNALATNPDRGNILLQSPAA